MVTKKVQALVVRRCYPDAQRIAGKRRAGTKLAKRDDAVRRVRFTGWFGLGCLVERKLLRPTVPDARIHQPCLAYPERDAKRSDAQRGATRSEATLQPPERDGSLM